MSGRVVAALAVRGAGVLVATAVVALAAAATAGRVDLPLVATAVALLGVAALPWWATRR